MINAYHILNGDALKEQFPTDQIPGEIIVMRECMVEGPVYEKNLENLLEVRAKYIKEIYGDPYYDLKVISEIKKIVNLENGQVNLWFEEDLFCQTNLWFTCGLLYPKNIDVSLIMPDGSSLEHGFGGLSKNGLIEAQLNRKALTKINVNQFALLWFAYRNDDIERLLKLGVQVYEDFPFVMPAVEAHFDRLTKDGSPSKPEQIINQIIKERSTRDFRTVFREFHKRAPIYGYGDLQIKRIFDSIIE